MSRNVEIARDAGLVAVVDADQFVILPRARVSHRDVAVALLVALCALADREAEAGHSNKGASAVPPSGAAEVAELVSAGTTVPSMLASRFLTGRASHICDRQAGRRRVTG